MAKDKGEHINSESTVAVTFLPIRNTKMPVNCTGYRLRAKHSNVYSLRKQTSKTANGKKMANARETEIATCINNTTVNSTGLLLSGQRIMNLLTLLIKQAVARPCNYLF